MTELSRKVTTSAYICDIYMILKEKKKLKKWKSLINGY